MKVRPGNAVTVLDTHDGIGIIDVGPDGHDQSRPGLLTPAQTDQLVTTIHDNSGGTSRLATGTAASNVDLYQVNCTFYDALGADDHRYLLARALQGTGRLADRQSNTTGSNTANQHACTRQAANPTCSALAFTLLGAHRVMRIKRVLVAVECHRR